MTPYLDLSIFTRGVRATGGVNDAPVHFSDGEGQTKQSRIPLNWWLMPGQNLFTLRVEPLPGASTAPLLDAAIAFPEDRSPPLCRVGWGLPPGVAFSPFHIRLPFQPPKAGQSRVWTDALPIADLTAAQREGAQALAMAVHGAFASRDLDAILKLLDYRMEEMCLAFEIDLAQHRVNVREDMDELVNGKGYALLPAAPDAVQAHPCCRGRLFRLTRADGGPLICTLPTATSRPTSMHVFGALVRGEWRVVR